MSFQCPFVLRDSLNCFADRGEEKLDSWYVRGDFRFMNLTTFRFLTATHYPRPTTFSFTRVANVRKAQFLRKSFSFVNVELKYKNWFGSEDYCPNVCREIEY